MVEESPGIDCNDRTRLSKQGNHSIHSPSVPPCNVLVTVRHSTRSTPCVGRDARDVIEPELITSTDSPALLQTQGLEPRSAYPPDITQTPLTLRPPFIAVHGSHHRLSLGRVERRLIRREPLWQGLRRGGQSEDGLELGYDVGSRAGVDKGDIPQPWEDLAVELVQVG
jgi:hypothetical protein